jgi:hypothetical protein
MKNYKFLLDYLMDIWDPSLKNKENIMQSKIRHRKTNTVWLCLSDPYKVVKFIEMEAEGDCQWWGRESDHLSMCIEFPFCKMTKCILLKLLCCTLRNGYR